MAAEEREGRIRRHGQQVWPSEGKRCGPRANMYWLRHGVMPLYDCISVSLSLPVFLVNAERRAPPATPAGDIPSLDL